ncbi:hypothetical protein GQ53DRAFT_291839 [Thozetella sp. PMI_491]|nr:hypothetical protein GQ53DRAFT_291839 [Thozetella sp. PMI_491]
MDQGFRSLGALGMVAMAAIIGAIDPARGRNNPYMQTIGAWGYHVQSNILRIPPRFGFFSPGPAHVQGLEGAIFAKIILALLPVFLALWFHGIDSLSSDFLVKIALMMATVPMLGWAIAIQNRNRPVVHRGRP